jgi:hypothetical protein
MRRSLRRITPVLFVLALAVASASVADDTPRWMALPGLEPAAVDHLAEEFDLRGTYGSITLAVAGPEAARELERRLPGAGSLGDHRQGERVYAIHLAPDERLKPSTGSRVLWRDASLAIVALPDDPSLSLHALLDERRAGLFHEGIVRVPERRQRPRAAAPAERSPFVHDPVIQAWVDSVSAADLEADVTSLSTIFTTRRSDTSGGSEAEQWLVDRFSALGLTTTTHSFDNGADNVVAEIPGAVEPERVVIVGAHYDSLAFGGSSAPGADDNASGTAALLEIARVLSLEEASFRHTLRLVAFASEEFGLIGSDAYSQSMLDQGVDVVAMLNTDMNAYRENGDVLDLDMVINNTTDWLNDDLIEIANLYVPDLPTRKGQLLAGTSDHSSFFHDGFPAAFYFEDTGDYSPYIHSSNDVVGLSANDFDLSRAIVQAVLAGAVVLAEPIADAPAEPLTVSGSCPGDVTVRAADQSPGSRVYFFRSRREGSSTLETGPCAGTTMDIRQPRALGSATADASGVAEFTRTFPSGACGVFLQAIDRGTCTVTNVVQAP